MPLPWVAGLSVRVPLRRGCPDPSGLCWFASFLLRKLQGLDRALTSVCAALGCRTLFESPHTAGLPRPVGAVLVCRNPPPDFCGGYCRDTRRCAVRSNPLLAEGEQRVLGPPWNAIAPALGEGWLLFKVGDLTAGLHDILSCCTGLQVSSSGNFRSWIVR